jgi:16S rRNA (cytidine1402-2'-O)-methyltransferase
MPGTLFVVATPIGNLEDITGRALRVLRAVAVIAAEDTRRTAHLLAHYAISTATTSLHEHNEAQKSASLVARLGRGEDVALVSDAGTPTISDPGYRLIRTAIEAGIRVESIPGPSAIIAALAVSGLPTDAFAFLGFPPTRSKARLEWFDRAKRFGGTIVFFEAPHRIRRTLEEMRLVIGDCPIMLARELTKAYEQLVRGQISSVLPALQSPRGEFTVIAEVGHVTEIVAAALPDAKSLLAELGLMTNIGGMSRRAAVAALAKRYNVRTNSVYETLEAAKRSGN